MNKPNRVLRFVWFAAGLALLLGFVREPVLRSLARAQVLAPGDGVGGGAWFSGGFRNDGAYPTTVPGLLPPGVPTIGSWIDGDAWQGNAETAWFAASNRVVRVCVAGYPRTAGCKLRAEFRASDGAITSVECPLPNPSESWNAWEIHRPTGATAIRIVAEDRSSAITGWVAFSQPFETRRAAITAAYLHAQIWTTVALALVLIWGPGLMWVDAIVARRGSGWVKTPLSPGCHCEGAYATVAIHDAVSDGLPRSASLPRNDSPFSPSLGRGGTARSLLSRAGLPEVAMRTPIIIGTGPLALAVMGIVIWVAGGWIAPQKLGFALVSAAWIAVGFALWRRKFDLQMSDAFRRVLALTALVVIAVVAKSFHSVGPEGELFRGTISRNFEMSDRLDSRYSFYVVQVAAHHLGPSSPAADKFFFPWTFFSRGPLAGLAAIPIVTATGGAPPATMPDDRWSPYDRAGFAAYRITMIVLASMVVIAVFLAMAAWVGEGWALIAAGLVALSPFGMHEMMFTWPKWIATAWLIASFGLAHARRPLIAGLALAVGYLYHPLVLLWAPWVALWAAGRAERDVRPIVVTLARYGAGAALVVVPWMALGALVPHSPETGAPGQAGFLVYWARADWHVATWATWWKTRWMNFANTFVPLHVYLADSSFNHPKLGSAYEASGRLVKFSQVWWNSLPFALGLGLWALSLAALGRALRTLRAAAWVLVIAPTIFVVAYWGMDPLGLMRECGHPLFVTLIMLSCVAAAREEGWLRTALPHRAVTWLQLPETWLMLWLTTLANAHPLAAEYNQFDAACLAINALALVAAASVASRARKTAMSLEPNALAAHCLPAS
jgi:hypothetical protein